ncbi:MAG: hypothetical protein E5V28_24740 [Mesorhizobium sp.]|nr:MAG: hypothetical protein E5V28_24740 [Mesorhizobium sp.]
MAKQSFSQKVEFPDETGVDCTPTRDCSPTRDCTIARSHDDRDCSACILYRPEVKVFGKVVVSGGCVQHGNDPTCEFNKAAQNKIYDADYALRKADCERLKTQERVQCEAEKAGERALCETGKEALKRIARTGNFANLDGSFQGRGKLGVCLESFQLANDLSRVDLSVGATGQVKADVSLKFTPLDIVGHLTCQAPWTEKQTFDATVPNTSIPISSTIELNSLEGASTIGFNVAEIKFPLQLNPGPTEFLLKSANMTLACQGLNLLKPLLISATPFIPELKGNFEHVEKARHLDMHVELPSQEIGGVAIQAKLSTTPPALLVSGGVK